MKITGNPKGFLSFLDNRGLGAKAKRVKDLWEFIDKVNATIAPQLELLNVILCTDPATVVSKTKYPQLDEILQPTFKLWEQVKFPIKDSLFVRSVVFDEHFNPNLPLKVIGLDQPLSRVHTQLKNFLDKYSPEQILLHPRISDKRAKKELIGFRGKSVPGDVYCEIAKKGIIQIRELETAKKYQQFSLNNIDIENIEPEFLSFAKAFKLIAPLLDEYVQPYSPKLNTFNTPVYEIKCLDVNGKFYMNLFDYEA